jgi:hypothetical protein
MPSLGVRAGITARLPHTTSTMPELPHPNARCGTATRRAGQRAAEDCRLLLLRILTPLNEGSAMLAMEYRGPYRVRVAHKPEPRIEHPGDAIVQVMRSCICGSDLHLYHGLVPDTRVGSVFGHEFVGRVVETGASVQSLSVGDTVLVPFNIFCGSCYFCRRELYSNCHNTNRRPPRSAAPLKAA